MSKNINLFYKQIKSKLKKKKFEIIFIDDGSKDNTWKEIINLCKIIVILKELN